MSNLSTDRVLLGPAVISYPRLFQASLRSDDKFETKYEVDILYNKGSDTHKKIKKMEEQAISNKWSSKVPGNLNLLVKKGDDKVDGEGDVREGYEGKLYSKAKANLSHPPQVTDAYNNTIENPAEIKGGDICVVLVHAFPYDNVTKGVILMLSGVRKIEDGEPLGGGGSPAGVADEMAGYEADIDDGDIPF